MFLYQVCLCYSVTIPKKSLDIIGKLDLIGKMLYVSSQG